MLKYKGREIPRYLDDCKKIVSIAEAFALAGYGGGALGALDYYEEKRV